MALRAARRRVRWGRLFGLLLGVFGGTGLVRMARGRIPEAPPRARVKPSLAGLPAVQVCLLRFLEVDEPGFAAASGFTWPSWKLVAPGLLVHHPKGPLLIDAGFSRRTPEELANYPFPRKQMLGSTFNDGRGVTFAPEALAKAGVDPASLKLLAFTHIHFDHLGGAVDLPGVKVLLPPEDLSFLKANRDERGMVFIPEHAQAVEGRTEALHFQPTPYETFPEHADLFGDGSVVFVKLPGHTPGHVGVFINVSESLRLFYVGDAVLHSIAVEQRLTKSLALMMSDYDRAQADQTVAELSAFHVLAPEVSIVPAHDGDAWDRLFGPGTKCLGGPAKGP